MSIWQDSRADALLRANWGKVTAEESGRQIATLLQLDAPVSKRAVIGRARRIGLDKLNGQSRPVNIREPVPVIPRKPRPKPADSFRRMGGPHMDPIKPPSPVVTDAPPERRVTLMRLKSNGCRYHIGDIGQLGAGFCPETKYGDSSYCRSHHFRCIQPPR